MDKEETGLLKTIEELKLKRDGLKIKFSKEIDLLKKIVAYNFLLIIILLIIAIYITPFDYDAFCKNSLKNRESISKDRSVRLNEKDLYTSVLCGNVFERGYEMQGNLIKYKDNSFDVVDINADSLTFMMISQFFWYVKFISISILLYGFYHLFRTWVTLPEKIDKYLYDFFQTLAIFMSFGFILILGLIVCGVL